LYEQGFDGQSNESFAAYFDTLLELSKSGQVYFVRYEDLLDKREAEVTSLCKFLFGRETLSDTNLERWIKQVLKRPIDVELESTKVNGFQKFFTGN